MAYNVKRQTGLNQLLAQYLIAIRAKRCQIFNLQGGSPSKCVHFGKGNIERELSGPYHHKFQHSNYRKLDIANPGPDYCVLCNLP